MCKKNPSGQKKKTVLRNEDRWNAKLPIKGPKSRHVHAFRHVSCLSSPFSYLPLFFWIWNVKEQPATQHTQHEGDVIAITPKEHVKCHLCVGSKTGEKMSRVRPFWPPDSAARMCTPIMRWEITTRTAPGIAVLGLDKCLSMPIAGPPSTYTRDLPPMILVKSSRSLGAMSTRRAQAHQLMIWCAGAFDGFIWAKVLEDVCVQLLIPKPVPWMEFLILFSKLWTHVANFPHQLPLCGHAASNRGNLVRFWVRSGVNKICLSASWKAVGGAFDTSNQCRIPLRYRALSTSRLACAEHHGFKERLLQLLFHMKPFFTSALKDQIWTWCCYHHDLQCRTIGVWKCFFDLQPKWTIFKMSKILGSALRKWTRCDGPQQIQRLWWQFGTRRKSLWNQRKWAHGHLGWSGQYLTSPWLSFVFGYFDEPH